MNKKKLIKTLSLLSLFIVSGCINLNKSSLDTSIESEVMGAFESLVDASKSLDANAYFSHFDHGKFTGLNADGSVWHSISSLEPLIRAGFPMVEKVLSLEFQNIKVTIINPATAILVNEYKQTMRLKTGSTITQSGGGTQVWSKTNGEWKLVSVSASDAKNNSSRN